MTQSRRSAGFTLVELLLVMAIIFLLAGFLFAAMGPAKKMARVTACMSNLRQLGMAYKMYIADYGEYPDPWILTHSQYVPDKRILFCPEDTSIALTGASSSYLAAFQIPPDFQPLAGRHSVDPDVVLLACWSHLRQQSRALKNDATEMTAPRYPFYLVLRADGRVERVAMSRVRTTPVPGLGAPTFTKIYPGEPGYEQARR